MIECFPRKMNFECNFLRKVPHQVTISCSFIGSFNLQEPTELLEIVI